jgi:hypothetical protein
MLLLDSFVSPPFRDRGKTRRSEMNAQAASRADSNLKITSEEKPRDCRKRMRFAFSSRVVAGWR